MSLTIRQQQVLDAAKRGLSVKETAQELGIAPGSVKGHRMAARRALDLPIRNLQWAPATEPAAMCPHCGGSVVLSIGQGGHA